MVPVREMSVYSPETLQDKSEEFIKLLDKEKKPFCVIKDAEESIVFDIPVIYSNICYFFYLSMGKLIHKSTEAHLSDVKEFNQCNKKGIFEHNFGMKAEIDRESQWVKLNPADSKEEIIVSLKPSECHYREERWYHLEENELKVIDGLMNIPQEIFTEIAKGDKLVDLKEWFHPFDAEPRFGDRIFLVPNKDDGMFEIVDLNMPPIIEKASERVKMELTKNKTNKLPTEMISIEYYNARELIPVTSKEVTAIKMLRMKDDLMEFARKNWGKSSKS